MKTKHPFLAAALLGTLAITSARASDITPAEARAIAKEAYIYGYPMVDGYRIQYAYFVNRESPEFKAPWNQLRNIPRVFTPEDKAVQTPNSDTPYSMIGLDLRTEPIVLTVPPIEKERYFSIQLIDLYTHNFAYIGSRATGNDGGSFLIAGPGWKGKTPKGVKQVIRTETELALACYRTQLFNPADLDNVKKVQAGYSAQPLSAFLGQPAPKAAPAIDFIKPLTPATLKTSPEIFNNLNFILQFCPTVSSEKKLMARFAKIGIGAGKTFNFEALDLEHKLEVGLGMKAGQKKVDAYLAAGMKNINGWKVGSLFGDRAFYNGDWLKRAAAAQGGIYGNNADEAMYPLTMMLANGEVLDGSKHNYTLTFPAGQFPPVNAFWSVTMYDGKTQLLIENPINRYLINSPMLPGMKTNADGSLTLYIQNKSPGADKESNWLPAPNGPIYLVMRLYWPKTEAPSILPPGEGTWQPPGIVKVN